jgi:hypothetical protein
MGIERLDARHASALLRFEQENRDWFARSVPDRGRSGRRATRPQSHP